MEEKSYTTRKAHVFTRGGRVHARKMHTVKVNPQMKSSSKRNSSGADFRAASLALGSETHPNRKHHSLKPVSRNAHLFYVAARKIFSKKTFRTPKVVTFERVFLGGKEILSRRVGPGAQLFFHHEIKNGNLSRMNLTDATFHTREISRFDFSEATLNNVSFTWEEPTPQFAVLDNVNFQKSSLRDAEFNNVCFTGYCNFRDANLEGTDFSGSFMHEGAHLDFQGSNISSQEANALLAKVYRHRKENGEVMPSAYCKVTYDEYSADDIQEVTGVDKETVRMALWAESIEVRDNISQAVVPSSKYNPVKHHVPQWELQRLTKESIL